MAEIYRFQNLEQVEKTMKEADLKKEFVTVRRKPLQSQPSPGDKKKMEVENDLDSMVERGQKYLTITRNWSFEKSGQPMTVETTRP